MDAAVERSLPSLPSVGNEICIVLTRPYLRGEIDMPVGAQ